MQCASRAPLPTQRQLRLTKLGRNIQGAWSKLEKLIESSNYDEAVHLAADLRDLASRGGDADAFTKRVEALRKRQMRRRGFFSRRKRVGRLADRS